MTHARILITGCSKGLGRATAIELARRGHEVIATGTHAVEGVFVSLVGTGRDDWSFGNDEPSLVKS